jgi:hypothetical protein
MRLPDVNFWLALAFEAHAHHVRAAAWFGSIGDGGSAFCRLTQQGFLRIATNPKAFGDEALTPTKAWSAYDALLDDPRVRFVAEPMGLEELWREATTTRQHSHRVWSDAYLVAFAGAAELAIVSFDHDFGSYEGTEWIRP